MIRLKNYITRLRRWWSCRKGHDPVGGHCSRCGVLMITGTGQVYVAPIGDSPLELQEWSELGYIGEDGVGFTPPEVLEIKPHPRAGMSIEDLEDLHRQAVAAGDVKMAAGLAMELDLVRNFLGPQRRVTDDPEVADQLAVLDAGADHRDEARCRDYRGGLHCFLPGGHPGDHQAGFVTSGGRQVVDQWGQT